MFLYCNKSTPPLETVLYFFAPFALRTIQLENPDSESDHLIIFSVPIIRLLSSARARTIQKLSNSSAFCHLIHMSLHPLFLY